MQAGPGALHTRLRLDELLLVVDDGVTALTPSRHQSLAPGAVRSPGSIDQDGVPEVTVMVGAVLRIGQRGQAGYVLREIGRRAGLGGIERPRYVPRPVRIPGPREVRPERHELVGERELWPADLAGRPGILRRV